MEYLASVVGISGAGKTTAIRGVQDILLDRGYANDVFHDRTASPKSQQLDRLLKHTTFSPETRLHIMVAARAQVINDCILPSLRNPGTDITLTDRYYPCSIAYQGYGEGLDIDYATQVALGGARKAMPNRIFVLDIPGQIATERIAERHDETHLFDTADAAFHERVRQGYLTIADTQPTIEVIDALQSKQQVAQHIAETIFTDVRAMATF